MDISLVTDKIRYTRKTIFYSKMQYSITDISQ